MMLTFCRWVARKRVQKLLEHGFNTDERFIVAGGGLGGGDHILGDAGELSLYREQSRSLREWVAISETGQDKFSRHARWCAGDTLRALGEMVDIGLRQPN